MDLTRFDGHTPGPWAVNGNDVVADDESAIADVAGGYWWRGRRPPFASNARLIAAALAEVRRLTTEADDLRRKCDELAARLEAAAAPVLEVRACGCSQAKAGRCVMGDYGALPIGTQLYAGAAPERAEPTDIEAVLRNAVDRAVDQCANATGQRAKIATFVNRTEIVNAAIAQIRGDAPTCETKGLLGASSGVGRECGMWIEGVCTSPEPCQHQQQARTCRCGPDGCPDRVSCPKGGAA